MGHTFPRWPSASWKGFGWTWSSSGVSDCAFPVSLNVFGIVAVVLDSHKPRHHGKVPYHQIKNIFNVYSRRFGHRLSSKKVVLLSCMCETKNIVFNISLSDLRPALYINKSSGCNQMVANYLCY